MTKPENEPAAPTTPEARREAVSPYIAEAERLRRSGRIAETITPLLQAIRLDPSNAVVHHNLGIAFLNCNRLAEAVGPLQRAIALKPDFAHAYLDLGIVAQGLGRAGAAMAALRRAAGLAPKLAAAHDRLGDLWVGLISLVFPRARIIHCRRNPIDTCLSIYTHFFGASRGYASNRAALVSCYRQYQRLMAHWRVVLPPERFLEVDYEALVADPEAGARRMIAFCGLEWDDRCLQPERNDRRIGTASNWQARQPIYRSSVERWRRYEPWLGELRELLPQ
jgi:tetratricopeptide (TPR) repeat protein